MGIEVRLGDLTEREEIKRTIGEAEELSQQLHGKTCKELSREELLSILDIVIKKRANSLGVNPEDIKIV